MPRNTPSATCVTRLRMKLPITRGVNCVEASVSATMVSAKTVAATVIIEPAIRLSRLKAASGPMASR